MQGSPAPLSYFEESLFPPHPFRFQMRFRKSDISGFFGPSDNPEQLLKERRKWMEAAPGQTTIILPEGRELLEKAVELVFKDQLPDITPGTDALPLLQQVSAFTEPDFLLLKNSRSGVSAQVVGGAVCFPSSWPLEEKVGRSLEFTHGPVPGLNDKLGEHINRFLQKIPAGFSWERTNWGLSRSPELNQHPARKLPRLGEDVTVQEVYLRIEWQSLVALPPEGVLFGIRVYSLPLEEAVKKERWKEGLKIDLQTMPEMMLKYKGLWTARHKLLEFLK